MTTGQQAGTPAQSSAARAVRSVRGPDGRTVAYAEYGDPGGTPVLFCHGTPGSRLLGAVVGDEARERGVRVLAPDRPGYGTSDPWPGRTLADTGAFLAPVLDDAGVDRAGVVGFSGGGPHAVAFAATHGDRVAAVDLVASAVPPDCLADPPRVQRLLETLAGRAPGALGGLFRLQTAVARRASPSTVVSRYTTDGTDRVPDDVAALVRRDFLEAVGASRNGVVTESRALGREWDVSLDRIDCPVRLWHGERDTNVPVAAARRFAERLPDADLTVFDDVDHLGTLLRCRSRMFEAQATVADAG